MLIFILHFLNRIFFSQIVFLVLELIELLFLRVDFSCYSDFDVVTNFSIVSPVQILFFWVTAVSVTLLEIVLESACYACCFQNVITAWFCFSQYGYIIRDCYSYGFMFILSCCFLPSLLDDRYPSR